MTPKANKVFPVKLSIKEKHLNYLQNHFLNWFNGWTNQSVIEELDEAQKSQIPTMEYMVTIRNKPILVMKCTFGMLARYFPNRELNVTDCLTDGLVNELLVNFITRLQPDLASEAVICRDSTKVNPRVHAMLSVESGSEYLSMSCFNEVYGWYIQSLDLTTSNISNIDFPVQQEVKIYSNY